MNTHASQSEWISAVKAARELRAAKGALVEQAKARLHGLQSMKALLAVQIDDARRALENAERDAKE